MLNVYYAVQINRIRKPVRNNALLEWFSHQEKNWTFVDLPDKDRSADQNVEIFIIIWFHLRLFFPINYLINLKKRVTYLCSG